MRTVTLLVLFVSAAFAGVLHLHGPSSMVRFGDDAVLTASCVDPPATVKYLAFHHGLDSLAATYPAHKNVTAYLSNVKTSCADIKSITQPCATGPDDTLDHPPLFYCLWYAGAQSVDVDGPYKATRYEVRASAGELMGFNTGVTCPLPEKAEVATVTGANPVTLSLQISHIAPSGSSANMLSFGGVTDGNLVTITYSAR